MGRDREAAGPAESDDEEEAYEAYFQEVSDGCGCTEIWEYLSDRRRRD